MQVRGGESRCRRTASPGEVVSTRSRCSSTRSASSWSSTGGRRAASSRSSSSIPGRFTTEGGFHRHVRPDRLRPELHHSLRGRGGVPAERVAAKKPENDPVLVADDAERRSRARSVNAAGDVGHAFLRPAPAERPHGRGHLPTALPSSPPTGARTPSATRIPTRAARPEVLNDIRPGMRSACR